MDHYEGCPDDHGTDPCVPIDWELQAKYDNDPEFKAFIDAALASPRVSRPRRPQRT